MRFTRRRNIQQFLAGLTILSVTFTQAVPAWALRPAGVDSPSAKAGLEDELKGTSSAALVGFSVADLEGLVGYFSKLSQWKQIQGMSEQEKADALISMLTDAIRGQEGTPEPVILALQEPQNYLPLVLRLIAPGDAQLYKKIDAQWDALSRECALCGAHILHENLDESTRRDLPSHLLKDLLSAAVTAYDARKLGSIPTRSIRPGKGHTEREVVTQTAYGLGIVGGLKAVEVGPGAGGGGPGDLARALAYILPPGPQGLGRLPLVHVQALGSQRRKGQGNHFIGVEAVDLGKGEIHLLDNGERISMPVQQFQRQYFPTGKLLVHPDQYGILEAMEFPMGLPAEAALLDTVGDCGTCAFKGDFPVGYHEPVEWGLVSAARLLYRGADGGAVQVRYQIGDALYVRSYRVAYNSGRGRLLTFRVEEIGPDQKRTFLDNDRTYTPLQANERFGYKPDTIKRKMAEMLRMLAYEPKFKLPDNAKILDVVTHFRWATHSFSDIKGTHPHQARAEEIGRTLGEPVAKAVTVSHNGIIYDYYDLGIELTAMGHTFESNVDTERYAHLLFETIQQQRPPTLLEAVRRTNERIRPSDTYGFQITSGDYPDEVVSARNESPLYVGLGEVTLKERGKPIPFFMTAAAPGAILPHSEILSRTLLPNQTVVQMKNGEITAINLKNQRYYLILPDGTISSGRRVNGQLAPEQVYIQELQKENETPLGPPQPFSTLTSAQMTRYAKGDVKLKVWASAEGRPAAEGAGLIIFQREKDIPEVYNLGEYPDYTTKELYESGDSMRRTLNRNTKLIPVYYIPRPSAGKKVEAGEVKVYRHEHVRRQTNAHTVTLTGEQAESIRGEREWTELVKLPDGEYAYVKLVPNIITPLYEHLYLPDFPDIPSWDELRKVEEVWGVSVGSSYFQDLDGYELIKRYAKIGVRTFNSDDLRDDEFWASNAAHKKVIAVMATTQSGATAVTRENMKKIKEASGTDAVGGARLITIADTNTPGSDITKSDYTELLVREGSLPEIGVLSTKAVHSQKTNKELFGMRLGVERRVMRPEAVHERIMELKEEAGQVDEALRNPEIEARLRKIAEEVVHTNIAIAGYRGFQGIAAEHGIKGQEGGEIFEMLFNMGTFLHGPAQLLRFSGVPEGGTAAVKAQFDSNLKQIVTEAEYRIPTGAAEDKLRGLPILVFYVPTEGDQKVRDRLESNFQTVISRGASVYVFTSPEYAKELRDKKAEFGVRPEDGSKIYVPMVKDAIGIPANPYTLTALGQKMALLYADIKNKELAEPLFEKAGVIYERQDEPVPAAYPSREEWLREALVEAYRKIEEFRANGMLAQIYHQETVGYTLSKINEAAKHPEDRNLVDEARDLTADLVHFIDVAQPGNLAKSVTVEAGAEETFELGLSEVSQRIRDTANKPAREKSDTDLDWALLEEVQPWIEVMGITPTVRYGDPWEGRPVLENPPSAFSRPFFYQIGQAGRPLVLVPAYDISKKAPRPQRILFVVQRGDFLNSPRFWALPADHLLKGRLETVFNLLGVVPAGASVGQVTQNLLKVFENDGKDHLQIIGQGEMSTIIVVGPDRPGMIEAITHPISALYEWNIDEAHAPKNQATARGAAGIVQVTVHQPLSELENLGVRETIQRNLARDPEFLGRLSLQIQSLIARHKKEGGVPFGVVEQVKPVSETALITVASDLEISALHRMIIGKVKIRSADVEFLPEGRAVSIVVLEGPAQQWAQPIGDIRRAIDTLFKFVMEFEAALYVNRKPKTDGDLREIEWLKKLFIAHQLDPDNLELAVEEAADPPSVNILAIAPVQAPQPSIAVDLVGSIQRRSKALGQEIAPTLSPVETIADPITNKPLVLVMLRFENVRRERLVELGVFDAVEEALLRLAGKESKQPGALRDFLIEQKNRSPQEAEWMDELYRQYIKNPGVPVHGVIESPSIEPHITFVAMVIPYTSAAVEQEPVAALGGWVRDIERENNLPPKALLRRLFVTEYQESPEAPLVAFVQVGFTRVVYDNLAAEKQIDFMQGMRDTLAPYIPAPKVQAGVEELDGEATPEILRAAQARGWKPVEIASGITLFQTPQGGWVSPSAVRGVSPLALITQGAWIRGAQTKIEANVRITRSLVENAEVDDGALIEDAIVRTDPKLSDDSWSWNDSATVGPVSVTRIGRNARITATVQGEPAEIINAIIGNGTVIQGGSVRTSEIGAANRLVRAKVGLTHTEDNVTIATRNGAPTEVSESWLGWGRTIDEEAYVEQYSPNFIRRAYVDADGSVKFATVENVPAVVLQGYSTIDASYDGSGKVGKEFNSSRHGEGVKWPGSVQGPLTNAVLMVHERFNDPADLLNVNSMDTATPYGHLTALGPLSYSRRAETAVAGMIWGQVRPGSERHGLSTRASDGALWMFENAQLALGEILQEMHRQVDNHAKTKAWSEEERAAAHSEVDRLPRTMLETGKALARLAKDSELEAQYDRHLAGEGKQAEKQRTLADLLATASPWRDRWQDPRMELFRETDRKLLAGLSQGIEADPSKNNIGEGARIIGARARLEGVTIPAGATVYVYGSYVRGGTLLDGSTVRNSVSINTEVQSAEITNSRLENSWLARGVKAASAVAADSRVGEKTTLEPYTRLARSVIGKNGFVGSPIENSILGDAVTDHHLLADLKGARTPNYDAGGVSIPNLTNFSSGARVRNATLHTTMTGANMEIGDETGPEVVTGFGSFVVDRLAAGEQVPAFAFSRGAGPQAKQAGAVLAERQNTVMRIVMGKTLKELLPEAYLAFDQLMQEQIASAGLTAEAPNWKLDASKPVKEMNAQTAFANGQWVYQPNSDETAGAAQGHGKYQWVPNAAGAEEQVLGRREAIQAIVDYAASRNAELTVEGPTPPAFLSSDDAQNSIRVEGALAMISSGQMRVTFSGRHVTVRAAAGTEEKLLPESDTSVQAGVRVVVGPHVSALAIGAAISRLTTPDGRAAAQVVFVVENAEEANLVKQRGFPMAVLSASEIGSVQAALDEARDLLPGAIELGTDGQPVPQTIQLILHNLFGIELSPESITVWNAFLRDIENLALQA